MATTRPIAATESTEPTIDLLGRPPITYQSALDTDSNIIHEVEHARAAKAQYQQLWGERCVIGALVKHHLGLDDRDTCIVADSHQWIRGSFNICIPIEVKSQSPGSCRKVMLRCAMPYKLAEAANPGSVDEKTSCEVGTYAWIQERCPDIRIPHLYGFGFCNHRHV